jgi:hypothetical protein
MMLGFPLNSLSETCYLATLEALVLLLPVESLQVETVYDAKLHTLEGTGQ